MLSFAGIVSHRGVLTRCGDVAKSPNANSTIAGTMLGGMRWRSRTAVAVRTTSWVIGGATAISAGSGVGDVGLHVGGQGGEFGQGCPRRSPDSR